MKSRLEISRADLTHNVRAIQEAVPPGTEILAVVKADAYGHGVPGVASALAEAGVRWLGVTDVEEGVRVRAQRSADDIRLLVMVGIEPADAPAVVRERLTPVVWTAEQVGSLEQAASAAKTTVAIHLEIDTGMSRQGAAVGRELAAVLDSLKAAPSLGLEGVFTHFAASETGAGHTPLTGAQQERFESALAQVQTAGFMPKFLHAANSSAIDDGSTLSWLQSLAQAHGARAIVRPGYAVYGHCLPLEGAGGQPKLLPRLRPVLRWTTRVLALREVVAGTTVGYGATFTAPHLMRLALLPVGYADGFHRAASSGLGDGWVMIGGERAPVVGRVSMNLTVVDVTHLLAVRSGDEVTLLGEGVTAEDHARWANTIGYEILCGLRAPAFLH